MANSTYRWDDYREQYRTDWERANPGRNWSDVEHGYRYGWESALNDRDRSRAYGDVESDLQRGWGDYDRGLHTSSTGAQAGHAWDDLKDTVRHGWERAKQQFRDTF